MERYTVTVTAEVTLYVEALGRETAEAMAREAVNDRLDLWEPGTVREVESVKWGDFDASGQTLDLTERTT